MCAIGLAAGGGLGVVPWEYSYFRILNSTSNSIRMGIRITIELLLESGCIQYMIIYD